MTPDEFLKESEQTATKLKDNKAEIFRENMAICSTCFHRQGASCLAMPTSSFNFIPTAISNGSTCPTNQHGKEPVKVCKQDPSKPNLVIISNSMTHGGAEIWVLSLAKWLPFNVTVVIADKKQIDNDMRSKVEKYAKSYVWGIDRKEITAAMSKADVFLAWGIGPLKQFTRAYKAPAVWTLHGGCSWTKNLSDQAAPVADYLVGVSEITKRVLTPEHAARMVVIPNGVEIERLTPVDGRAAIRRRWGVTDGQFVVGYIGRLSPEKRPCAAVEAISKLDDRHVAVIVGDGWKSVETKAQAAKINTDRTKFVGYTHNVGDALAGFDCWINASPSEGDCLSLKEAMLAGVPVISTPTGAIPELEREHGRLTWGVPIGATPSQLAAVVDRMRKQDRERIAITEKARILCWNQFTAAAMANRWKLFLTKVTAGSPVSLS